MPTSAKSTARRQTLRRSVGIVLATFLLCYARASPAQTNPVPPAITIQPLSRTASVGDNLMFSVAVTGTPPFAYQWQFNGTNLPGATNPALNMVNLTNTQAGPYAVVVTTAPGSVTSAVASLTIQPFVLSWQFILLYAFQGGADGASPGGLARGVDGNIYGITKSPVARDKPTVFQTTPGGVETPIHTFPAGAGATAGLIRAADGNFYGAAGTTVFQITTNGGYAVFFTLPGGANGGGSVRSLFQTDDGSFVGTTDGVAYSAGNGPMIFQLRTNCQRTVKTSQQRSK